MLSCCTVTLRAVQISIENDKQARQSDRTCRRMLQNWIKMILGILNQPHDQSLKTLTTNGIQ